MSLDPLAQLALRLALALVLGAAALHKLRAPVRFRAALAEYRLLPARLEAAAARALPALESLAALGLLVPALARGAAALAGALFVGYGAAIGANLARGRREIDCGCSFGGARQPLSGALVARNGVLAALAAAAALPAGARAPLAFEWGLAALAASALALLYHAADGLLAARSRLPARR
jgi:hypothetical protein